MAVVADSSTASGFRGVRLAPWEYTGKTVVGGDAADRKLISMVKALKQNVKTYGQVQLTYAWLVADCAKCNPTVQHATIEMRITLPPDWVAPDDRVYRFVRESCPYDIVVPAALGAGMTVAVQLPADVGVGGRDPRLDALSTELCPETTTNECPRRVGAKLRLLKG